MVPVRKRGIYVGMIVFTILPFCPSVVYAQLIAKSSNWRMNGVLVGVWNFLGLIMVTIFYKDPPRVTSEYSRRKILSQVDYIGGILSTGGVLCFMMGMQFGAQQVGCSALQRVLFLTSTSVSLEDRHCPRSILFGRCSHHRLLRLGIQVRTISNGASSVVHQTKTDNDIDPPDYLPEWRQLLCPSSLLANTNLQCLR
jgi:hypothetical protein